MKDVTAFLNQLRGNKMNDNFRAEAINVVQRHKESVEYFSKFGSALDKAIAKVFLEAAEVE
jgi:hypothetical protein